MSHLQFYSATLPRDKTAVRTLYPRQQPVCTRRPSAD